MLDGALSFLPNARVGCIGLRRDEKTLDAEGYLEALPSRLSRCDVLVLDPMLATGGSAIAAAKLLRERGARELAFVHVLATPEGVKALRRAVPGVRIVTAALDDGLDTRGFSALDYAPQETWPAWCAFLDRVKRELRAALKQSASPLAAAAQSVTAIEIPGEINSLSAESLAETARQAGCRSVAAAPSLAAAAERLAALEGRPGRLLICGSLYLAGRVLADHS